MHDVTQAAERTIQRLLQKSKEAFTLAVELYNRPTLENHAEACSIFLCNAWELMLKAHLIKKNGPHSIYYTGDSERTFSLEDCLKRVFTNEKDPLRRNMTEIIKFRNISTHFITDEYDFVYGPLLQACVKNYGEKLEELHEQSVSDLLPDNYLTLIVNRTIFDPEEIRTRYEPEVAEKLLSMWESTQDQAGDSGDMRYAFSFDTNLRLVKKIGEEDLRVRVDSSANSSVAIVKELQDPKTKYPFRRSKCVEEIGRRLKRKQVKFFYNGNQQEKFTSYHWDLFVKAYDFKSSSRFSYDTSADGDTQPRYTYSQEAVEQVVYLMRKDPHGCLDAVKNQASKA